LRNIPLHKRESVRKKMPFPFVLWHCLDEGVKGKRNSVYLVEVGMRVFERARQAMVEETWPLW
jgi:hypothetical protein